MKSDILHVIPDFATGGAEHVAAQLLLEAQRFSATAVCMGGEQGSALEQKLAQEGVNVAYLGKTQGCQPSYWRRLRKVIRESGARVLHTHRHVMPYVLPELMAHRELKCVHTLHNLAEQESHGATRLAQRAAFRLGAVPVAIARAVQASIEKLYGLTDVTLIPNGIPLPRYASAPIQREWARQLFGYGDDDVVYACLARLNTQKNHSALLNAFARKLGSDSRAHLLLAGDGPYHGELQGQAGALGLSRVRFIGVQADVTRVLAAADVVVLPSLWEGSPLCVMEAMTAGRAVVATSVGGVPELIRHDETGLLVPAADVASLAAAMEQCFDHAALRERLGAAARAHALAHFDSNRMARGYESLYAELLQRRPVMTPSRAW
ncbi:MAG TPA: glycosyltransferase [Verrucomicrobiae bacterium]|nr:glycosyltransferase [Verrucomicrobiae bacterium]